MAQARDHTWEGFLVRPATCADTCGDDAVNRCYLDEAYLEAFAEANPGVGDGEGGVGGGSAAVNCPAQGAVITCEVTAWRGEHHPHCPVPGRRPSGLADVRLDPTAVGRFFASSAYFEAASVVAFERLAAELAALGAPEDLVRDLTRAAADEVRHAAVLSALAERDGARVEALSVAPATARSIEDIAIENAVEGMVNETFAAALARFQAENAADPVVRAALSRIADDECGHAALAFRVAELLEGRLDAPARARVEARRRDAVRALGASIEEPAADVRRVAGVPTRAEAMAVYRRMCSTVWAAERGGAALRPAA